MKTLIRNISSLVTVDTKGKNYKSGKDLNNISEIKSGAILFDSKILWIGSDSEVESLNEKGLTWDIVVDGTGKTVMPGFVDSHTHIVFSGDRSDEFAKRLRGATYQEIAESGGGIQSTVRATRSASVEELYNNGLRLAINAIAHGTTSFEIKSGYSLNLEGELKQLQAIALMKKNLNVNIKSTFLGAHDFPIEYKNNPDDYVDYLCDVMLPKVAESGLADYCDAFVDKGYYTVEQGKKILETAKKYGMSVRLHADELADVGAGKLAADIGCVSADHLLFVSDESLLAMKNSGTVACLLPGTAYFIRMPYANARKIIDMGIITAIATDTNPGSCFTENMQLILSLATINMRMTAEEAIAAATINGAYSLGISDITGSLEPGKDADIVIYECKTYSDIMYHFGINHVSRVYIKGQIFNNNN